MTDVTSCENALYATSTFPIMHLICLPPPPRLPPRKEICITFVFHFSWVLQPSQEKLKILLMQNLGGSGGVQIRGIMGNVEEAYRNIVLVANIMCATNYKIKNL